MPNPSAQNQLSSESQNSISERSISVDLSTVLESSATTKPNAHTENMASSTSTVLSLEQNVPLFGANSGTTSKAATLRPNSLVSQTCTLTQSAVPLAVAHKSAPKAVKSFPRPQISQQAQTQTKVFPTLSQNVPTEQPDTKSSNKTPEFQDILAIAAQTADIYEMTLPSETSALANESSNKSSIARTGAAVSLMQEQDYTLPTVTDQEDDQTLSSLIDNVISFETETVSKTPSSSSAMQVPAPLQFTQPATNQEVSSSNLNLVQSFTSEYHSLPGNQTFQSQPFSTLNHSQLTTTHSIPAQIAASLLQHKSSGPLPPITQIFAHTKSRSNAIGNFVLPGSLQMSSANNNTTNSTVDQNYQLSLNQQQQSASISQLNMSTLNSQQTLTHNVNSVSSHLSALPGTTFNIASNPLQMQSFPIVNANNPQAQKFNFVYQMNSTSGNFVLLSPPTPAVATPTNRVFLVQVKNNDKNVFSNNLYNSPLSTSLQPENSQSSSVCTLFQSVADQQQKNVQLAMLPNGQSALTVNQPAAIDTTIPTRGRPRKVAETQSYLLPLSASLSDSLGNTPKLPNSTSTMSTDALINSTELSALQTANGFPLSNASTGESNLILTKQNNTTVCVQTNYSELVEKTAIQAMQNNEALEQQSTLLSEQLSSNDFYKNAQKYNFTDVLESSKLQTSVLHNDSLVNNINASSQPNALHTEAFASNQETTLPSTKSTLELTEQHSSKEQANSELTCKQPFTNLGSSQSTVTETNSVNTASLYTFENQLINNKSTCGLPQETSNKTAESMLSTSAVENSVFADLNHDSDTEEELVNQPTNAFKSQSDSKINNEMQNKNLQTFSKESCQLQTKNLTNNGENLQKSIKFALNQKQSQQQEPNEISVFSSNDNLQLDKVSKDLETSDNAYASPSFHNESVEKVANGTNATETKSYSSLYDEANQPTELSSDQLFLSNTANGTQNNEGKRCFSYYLAVKQFLKQFI